MHFSLPHPTPVVYVVIHSNVVVLLLFIHCYCCWGSVFGPCFVVLYLVPFLVLQSSWRGRESWFLYFHCLSGVLWLWLTCGSSSQCLRLVCCVLLWYLLIIYTYFFIAYMYYYILCPETQTLMGKRELIALLNLSSWCLVMVERLFLAVPRGCLQFVIVVFPDHTHLLFLKKR